MISFQIFQLILCSADDGLAEPELKKIYKISAAKGDTIDGINYKIIKGGIHLLETSQIQLELGTILKHFFYNNFF